MRGEQGVSVVDIHFNSAGELVFVLSDAMSINVGTIPDRDGTVGGSIRYLDCGDGTVADTTTGLLWEAKTGTPGTPVYCGGSRRCVDPHDVNSRYSWSARAGFETDGTVFTDFLLRLNGGPPPHICFASHCDWRLPTRTELQGIMTGPGAGASQPAVCTEMPCIDLVGGGPNVASVYWSSSEYAEGSYYAWGARFDVGMMAKLLKEGAFAARAVREGSCP